MAMPSAHMTPMMASTRSLLFRLATPMIMEATKENRAAPSSGGIPV